MQIIVKLKILTYSELRCALVYILCVHKSAAHRIYTRALFESKQVKIFSFSYKLHWMVLVGLCKSEHALLQTNVQQPNARTISRGRCMHKSAAHRIYTRALFELKKVKIFSFSYKLHWMVLVGLCKSEHALLQTNVEQPNARTISRGRCMHKSAVHRIYTRALFESKKVKIFSFSYKLDWMVLVGLCKSEHALLQTNVQQPNARTISSGRCVHKSARIGYIQGRCSIRNRLNSSVSAINCIGWSQLVYAKMNMHCYRPMFNSLMQGPYQGVDACIKVRRIGYIQGRCSNRNRLKSSVSAINCIGWSQLVYAKVNMHCYRPMFEQPNARTISSGRCMHKSAVHRIYTRALFELKQVKIFSFSYKLHWMVLVGLCKNEHALLQTNVQQPNARTISSGRCMHKSAAHRIYTRALFESKQVKSSVSAINCIGWSQLVYAKVNMHCYRPMSNSLMQGPYQVVDACIKVRRIGYIQGRCSNRNRLKSSVSAIKCIGWSQLVYAKMNMHCYRPYSIA